MRSPHSLYRLIPGFIPVIFLLCSASVHAQGTGIPDMSFGNSATVLTKIVKNNDDISQTIAVTPDKRIVIAGNSFNILGYSNIAVVRYKANGARDKTFNGTGIRLINNAFCNAVAIQPDKKIVIGGSVAIGSNTVFGLWRLNSDGTNDSTFGTNGYQTVAFSGYVICFTMTLQNDDKILIGGNDGNFYAGNSSLILARLKPNGQLDNTFSGDGKFSLNLTRKSLTCNEILLKPNGDIIATGQLDTVVRPSFINEFFATRLHSNGIIDSSFGNNGIVRVKNSISDIAYCAGLLPDGRIVMGGFSKLGSAGNIASVLCITAKGTVDNTFGINGWVYPAFYGATAVLNAALVQPNGKIILAGDVYNTNASSAVGLVRLNGNGTLDQSFANNGLDTFFNSAGAIGCNDAALQPDGKILITGYKSLNSDAFFTARFLNDQQLAISSTNENNISIAAGSNAGIYPNPVTGNNLRLRLNIKATDVITVRITLLSGQQIMQPVYIRNKAGISEETIQLPPSVTNGTYLCIITSKEKTTTLKFIIQK
ncbi:MAG: T9SS type A sorting domain-containing protein [Panacibacter sp.]